MSDQIIDLVEANMPVSADVVAVAKGAGSATAHEVATIVATDVASGIVDASLATKIDKNGIGQISLVNLSNEVKQAMSGGTALIWDETTDDLEAEIAAAPHFGYRKQVAASLLDLNDPHAQNMFVMYNTGRVLHTDNQIYVYVVPVTPGVLYMTGDVGSNAVHLVFTSRYNDPVSLHINQQVVGYISGTLNNTPTNGIYEFTVPDGARFVIISSEHVAKLTFSQVAPLRGSGLQRIYQDTAINELATHKLDARRTRNMFNPQNRINGLYAYYGSGLMTKNNDWAVTAIRVEPGQVLSFNTAFRNAHVVFLECWIDSFQSLGFTQHSYVGKYIAGFYNDPKQGYIVPDNAHMLLASLPLSAFANAQIEEGEVSTAYVPAKTGIFMSDILDATSQTTLTVGAGRAYATISEAVAAASDDDEIVVYPGVYEESVKAWGKRLTIRGTSKHDCILKHSAMDYTKPPIEMSHGTLASMTIIADNTGTPIDNRRAYCLHVEDNTSQNQSFMIQDVVFINNVHACIGVGLRNHYTLELRDCEFYATGSRNEAVYCHDHETSTHGEDDQHLKLINCTLTTNGGYVIHLQSQEISGNHATLTAQRNILTNTENPDHLIRMSKWADRNEGQNGLLESYAWSLTPTSQMNTTSVLNI